MAEYRYLGVDLLTRRIVEDLPLYGTSFTRRLSGAGNMTGSYKLGTGLYSDEDLLAATDAGRMALVAMRDDVVIWAGPIWSRTYQSQANVMPMTGQSYESIPSAVKLRSTFSRTGADQLHIFRDLLATLQAQPYNNFGMNLTKIGSSGVLRDLTVEWFEHRFFSEPIGDLLEQEGSFDYTMLPYFDANEILQIDVLTGYPYMGVGQEGIALDYPGQITNYYWPESAARGGTRHTFLGAGEGSGMAYGEYQNQAKLNAGYPAFDRVVSNKSITDNAQATRAAAAAGEKYGTPVTNPTFELKLTEDIEFGEWNNLGVPVSVTIQDVRFPQQNSATRRMLGWDLTPSSSESVDMLKLILEGNDES
jgi:hypothetical protein